MIPTRFYLKRVGVDDCFMLVVEELGELRRGRCAVVNDRPAARKWLPMLREALVAEFSGAPRVPLQMYSPAPIDG